MVLSQFLITAVVLTMEQAEVNFYNRMSALLDGVRSGTVDPELDIELPFVRLDAPGMPTPGPNFVSESVRMGADLPTYDSKKVTTRKLTGYSDQLHYLYRRALYDGSFSMNVDFKGALSLASFIPGHRWACNSQLMNGGPVRSPVMVLGKQPGPEEVAIRQHFTGPSSSELKSVLYDLDVTEVELSEWYVTNLVKFPHLSPGGGTIPVAWIADCMPLLQQELRLVLPDYLLCLGSEASKAVLGKNFSVTNMAGRSIPIMLRINDNADEPPRYHTIQVMAAMSPTAVHRTPELEEEFRSQLSSFVHVVRGGQLGLVEEGIDHGNIYSERELSATVDAIIADPDPDACIIAVDAEWHGDYPTESNSYIRTIQFSYKDKWARCVVLRRPGGEPIFAPSIDRAVFHLNRLLKSSPGRRVRVGGHFLRADLPWLLSLGIDVRDEYAPDPVDMRGGGWDTSLMTHAVNETARFGLTDCTLRLTEAPRYDTKLDDWKKSYCTKHKLKPTDLEGYGECLHGHSRVQLADGSWEQIGRLVRSRYSGKVKANVNGKLTDTEVVGWYRKDVNQRDWFKVVTASTASTSLGPWSALRFTPDHEILTQRGKVRVDDIVAGIDAVVTDEPRFSCNQLSILLASALGDGGFREKSAKGVAFGFGQSAAHGEYAEWKAESLSEHSPRPRKMKGFRRFELPTSRQLYDLSVKFPRKMKNQHGKRKLVITAAVLQQLGLLGLAVWYQDDGSLAKCGSKGKDYFNSRIYCQASSAEVKLVLAWLESQFGEGCSYNQIGSFFQISKEAFRRFHCGIQPYMHPAMAYKTPLEVVLAPAVSHSDDLFCELIVGVVKSPPPDAWKGNGIRYCLTTGAGNFLTSVGFVSNCPAEVLCPDKRRLGEDNPSYGAYDADVTRRIAMKYLRPGGKLDADQFGNNCWEAYWRHHRVSLAVLEMEQTGFAMDPDRVDELTQVFMQASSTLRNHIRSQLRWPGFNEQSTQHMAAVLFGDSYVQKKHKITGQMVGVLPPGVLSLGLTPVTTTGKRPKLWSQLKESERHQHSPATSKEVLGILSDRHPLIRQLRDLKFLSQVLKTTLRRPTTDDDGTKVTDEDGNFEYEDGLISMIHADGRLRTHLSQVLETCRFASRRPNLQNLSSRREDDYVRIMNKTAEDFGYQELWGRPIYNHPLRSIICVPPGYIGIEADLKGAELAVLAWQAQDPVMMDHIRRNFLPEDHPDFMDLHAYRAVSTYKLPCAPTKKGLKSIGRAGLRVAAKAINFGIPYGQGAEAFVRKCLEEGVQITAAECQAIIDSYYEDYANVKVFLDECETRSQDPRWVSGPFLSYRRVPATAERSVIGEQKRQFRNFTIQNGVAESVNDMLYNFLEYRKAFSPDELSYRLLMQIHDSVILLVPYQHVDRVYNEVMDHCMTDLVDFRPRRLDGTLIEGAGPYHFGIDKKCFIHWGESITEDEMNRYHLPSCVLG